MIRSLAVSGCIGVVFSATFMGDATAAERPKSTIALCAEASEAAQSFRDDRKLQAAREKLLACARPECPKPIKRDCDELLSEVDAAMPTIVLAARDAEGRDLTDVKVLLDGTPLEHALE